MRVTPGTIPIAGRFVRVPGLVIVNSADASWCALDSRDFTQRRAKRPGAIVLHTTGGKDPQQVLPGSGKRGHAREIFELWSGADHGGGEKVHSAAPIVIDFDGGVCVAVDLMRSAGYHAMAINDHSVGVEMCTTPSGGIYEATLDAAVRLCAALTEPDDPADGLGIPFQVHSAVYRNGPLIRLEKVNGDTRTETDGHDVYGIIGHRDQTGQRGRGDPGDEVYRRLVAAGAEPLDYGKGDDLVRGRARQEWLRAHGASGLVVDCLVGPASLAAARAQGYRRWRDVPTAG